MKRPSKAESIGEFLPHWPCAIGKAAPPPTLKHIKNLLSKLGDPHTNVPPVIHVAGTNGKGSTIAFLQAMFEAAGYKVHKYTSPHLVHFNERIVCAGSMIKDQVLYRYIEQARIAAGDDQLTFFEGTTAAAFLAFADVKADVLLLETGMGGRFDPTNVIKQPMMSIITPISYDHVEFLGNTLAKIAYEKAGIIKHKVPCVMSWQHGEAMEVLLNQAVALESSHIAYGINWLVTGKQDGFIYEDHECSIEFPKPALIGLHQMLNAGTAVAAVKHLEAFNITQEQIKVGLAKVKWPARLELVRHSILNTLVPEHVEIWLDGAHNYSGAQMIAEFIKAEWLLDNEVYIINGRTKDRDIAGFLEFFNGIVKHVVAVPVSWEPKSEDPSKIAAVASEIGFTSHKADSVSEAVTICAKLHAGNHKPAKILITGSLYLFADI